MDHELAQKKKCLDRFLEGDYLLAHLDARKTGVDLPDHLKGNPSVTLKLSYWFKGPLKIEDDKVVTELLFGETYHNCNIPLSAIWGLTSEKGERLLFPSSIPDELLAELSPTAQASGGEAKSGTKDKTGSSDRMKKSRPTLKRVK